jgi:hypothetical protein
LTQVRSIRSEIKSALMTIDHNYLIINDISILIESTYNYYKQAFPKINNYHLKVCINGVISLSPSFG